MKKQKIENLELWKDFIKYKNIKKGNKYRNKLVEIYYPIISQIAYAMSKSINWKIQPEELESWGIDGLYQAINRFEIDKGVDFPSYAHTRIRGSMIDHMRQDGWVPRSVIADNNKIEKAKNLLREEKSNPTDLDVVESLGITKEQYLNNTKRYNPPAVLSIEGSNVNKVDTFHQDAMIELKDNREKEVDFQLLRDEFFDKILEKGLCERHKQIIRLYYYDGLNQREVGERIGMSESRVSQIMTDALPIIKVNIMDNPSYFGPEIAHYFEVDK